MPALSLTVIIPCFNEQGNIQATVTDMVAALAGVVEDYELLVFDDCSTDDTKRVIEALARQVPRIRPVYNPVNMGLGYNYRKGVELAAKEYVIMFPGDNEIVAASVRDICARIGEADIVIPYIANYGVRPWQRRMLSRSFTLLVNLLCFKKVRYYNGPVLHKKAVLQKVKLNTDGFAYQAQILIQLLRMGHTYVQVPMLLQPRTYGRSRALRTRNIASVLKTILSLALHR